MSKRAAYRISTHGEECERTGWDAVKGEGCLNTWDNLTMRIFPSTGALAAVRCCRSSGTCIQSVLVRPPPSVTRN